ncbi:MAG: transposase [Nitrospirales bacterium]
MEFNPPYQNGTTHLVMSPLEFLQRLAALVRRTRHHLIRFHGMLASTVALRSQLVPGKADQAPMGTAIPARLLRPSPFAHFSTQHTTIKTKCWA